MRTLRAILLTALAACAPVLLSAPAAMAQASIDATATPELNESATGPLGPLPSIAALMFFLGVVILILIVVSYMRFAPRFSRDEEQVRLVRADRVRVGQDLPRRSVDVSQAAAVVVAPPAIPGAEAPAPAPAAAPSPSAAPRAEGPQAGAATSAPAAEAPPADAPPAAAPPAAAPAAEGAGAPAAPAAEERPEVSLDDEVFKQTLDDLLAKGTDRRVAEGQARRAAMIAARKKAGG